MTYTKLLMAVLVGGLSFGAFAADEQSSGETSVKMEDVKETNKVGTTEDTDQIITNRKLRAETGSKSKWSTSISANYSGSTLKTPFSRERPDISSGGEVRTLPQLSGGVGVKYRMTAKDNLGLDISFGMEAPFNGGPEDNGKQKLEVNDPSLTYNHVDKLADVQSVSSLSYTGFTTDYYVNDKGYDGQAGIAQYFLYDFGGSSATLGFLLNATRNIFNQNVGGQTEYSLGGYPFFEYVINDTFNFRTISGVWVYRHARGDDNGVYRKNPIYQSIGLGTSITRDIYLYPNVQFLPEDIDVKKTNWALNATINI